MDVIEMISANFIVKRESHDLKEGYEKLMQFLDALEPICPKNKWHRIPRSANDLRANGWVSVTHEDTYLRRVARDLGDDAERYPGLPGGFSALIANASDEASYATDGRTVITYHPPTGYIAMDIVEPDMRSADLLEWTRAVFLATCTSLEVEYARCDRPRPPRPNGNSGETYYGVDHRVFPHREFLGWMGFVKDDIRSHQVPEADELIPLREKGGTMIVAVADAFDVHNPAHIEKAQRVEMRLVDIDRLPVTDPRFL
jgi:hypothetical protein